MNTKSDNYCRCSKCIEQYHKQMGENSEPTIPATSEEDLFKQRKDPFYFKGYWYQEYLKMREKYWKQTGENPEQAERIRELEEQWKVMEFLLNEAIKDLEKEQAEKRELYAMLGHIVDWGGRTLESEYGDIDCNGKWCAEQAKEALK